nr:hypothetical protein [Kibdelosporangium sp. MJ126-NF4]CEL12909.1 hypothetical protein [Kibdelosporangium sp. MJ126-NF4]CTQ98594.1 hypothetical protein [Kibdelosporangium sp. MJ126-NF4]
MNRQQLYHALRDAGVADGIYQIAGVHEWSPVPPDFCFLREVDDAWEVGIYERGQYRADARLGTETEACDRLYRLLTGRRP